MKRIVKKIIVIFVGVFIGTSIITEVVLFLIGLQGPSLLYISPTLSSDSPEMDLFYPKWQDIGQLPPELWESMHYMGYRIQYNLPVCNFWGGMTANISEVMFATGPDGIAIARSDASGEEGRQWGGYMRSLIYAPHWVMLPLTLLCLLYYILSVKYGPLLLVKKILAKLLIPEDHEGHCEKCGYCLYGLTVPRCPECGTPFDPKMLGHDMDNNPINQKESS